MIQIEFFHDAVCGWCYIQSPRLRAIAERYPVEVIHRSFVLQKNNDEMISRFGSLDAAKNEILQHWQHCKAYADAPELINIEGMRAAAFDYPTGYLSARYAKAVERVGEQISGQAGGQCAHWDFFDAVQKAHLYFNQNINDPKVLDDIVTQLQLPLDQIHKVLLSRENADDVERDIHRAQERGISRIPAFLINGQNVVSQSLSYSQLATLIQSELDKKAVSGQAEELL
ncbi:DsbA family oxidoreductase [Catenovulum sediminis]|uniref:DsbA family protein n=1 Tax=Catenovulum sediminis TaxID=1740262 RepID=A0ABV1RE53_9ALTE